MQKNFFRILTVASAVMFSMIFSSNISLSGLTPFAPNADAAIATTTSITFASPLAGTYYYNNILYVKAHVNPSRTGMLTFWLMNNEGYISAIPSYCPNLIPGQAYACSAKVLLSEGSHKEGSSYRILATFSSFDRTVNVPRYSESFSILKKDIVKSSFLVQKNPAFQDQATLPNVQKVKIGSFILTAGPAESYRVTNINVNFASSSVAMTDISNLYVEGITAPISPQINNNFPVNFFMPANSTRLVYILADVNNISAGSYLNTYLTVSGNGLISQAFISDTIKGQTITAIAGTLDAPTLVNDAYPSALIIGGTSAKIAQYKFVANNTATVTDMKFNVTGATTTPNWADIQSLTVNGVTAPVFFDGTARFNGLNLTIPAGTSGQTFDVTANLNPVTPSDMGGATTRDQVRLNLVSYSYRIGNAITTDAPANVASNVMTLVASAPVVNLASDTATGQSSGFAASANTEAIRFTVTAGANAINLKNVGFTPVYTGTLTSTSTQYASIYDMANPSTALGMAAVGNSGAQGSLAFDNDYVIGAGQTVEFIIKATTTGLTTIGNSFRIDLTATGDTGVSIGNNWQWNDGTTIAYGNGYLIKNLPVTGNTFVK